MSGPGAIGGLQSPNYNNPITPLQGGLVTLFNGIPSQQSVKFSPLGDEIKKHIPQKENAAKTSLEVLDCPFGTNLASDLIKARAGELRELVDFLGPK